MGLGRWISLCGLVFLLACGQKSQESELNVTNGFTVTQETEYTKPVVMLQRSTRNGFRGFCTGTFVSDTTMITAMHCVAGANNTVSYPYVKTASGRFVRSTRIWADSTGLQKMTDSRRLSDRADALESQLFSQYRCDMRYQGARQLQSQIDYYNQQRGEIFSSGFSEYDLAVVLFPRGTGRAIVGPNGDFYEVHRGAFNAGERVKFIGFGKRNRRMEMRYGECSPSPGGDGFGTKRQGQNTLSSKGVTLKGSGVHSREAAQRLGIAQGEQVAISSGDSGGPWILCASSDGSSCDSYKLIGVNSTSVFQGQNTAPFTGVNLQYQRSLKILDDAVNCDTSQGACAEL